MARSQAGISSSIISWLECTRVQAISSAVIAFEAVGINAVVASKSAIKVRIFHQPFRHLPSSAKCLSHSTLLDVSLTPPSNIGFRHKDQSPLQPPDGGLHVKPSASQFLRASSAVVPRPRPIFPVSGFVPVVPQPHFLKAPANLQPEARSLRHSFIATRSASFFELRSRMTTV